MLIAKIFFLVSLLKGLDNYPKPLFWAGLYVVFLFVSSYMFALAAGGNTLPVAGLLALNFALSAGYFTALRELDGFLYWGVFAGGLLLLAWIP